MEPKDDIKGRIRVSELISEYLELKPAGSGSFKAICPFHSEKSPSFHVSDPKEIWHCFGCDKGGDIFSFVMEMEGIDFREALEMLAKKTGVTLPVWQPTGKKPDDEKKKLFLDLHTLAQKVYAKILLERQDGEEARVYLENRGITRDLAEKFGLGFAPDRWDTLTRFFALRNISPHLSVSAGLISSRKEGGGHFDRFRHRLMIPLCDKQGNTVGFTARILTGEDGPKYLNSPETAIYHKGEMLYGLHLAKNAIRKEKKVIIVEGNLDVIASHKAGVEYIVASSGTALTANQLQILRRYTNYLLFCFDGDDAGFEAAKRGISLAQSLGFEIGIIAIPKTEGKDPDDVVKKNPETWRSLAQNPIPVLQYFFERALLGLDPNTAEGKKLLAQSMIPEIAKLQDAVEREHWLQKLSDIIRVDTAVLRAELQRQKSSSQSVGTSAMSQKPVAKISRPAKSERIAEVLMGSCIAFKEQAAFFLPRIDEVLIPEGHLRDIYKNMVLLYTRSVTLDTAPNHQSTRYEEELSALLPEHANIIRRLTLQAIDLLSPLAPEHVREEIERHLTLLKSVSEDALKRELQAQIREAERSGENERLQELISQYTKLI